MPEKNLFEKIQETKKLRNCFCFPPRLPADLRTFGFMCLPPDTHAHHTYLHTCFFVCMLATLPARPPAAYRQPPPTAADRRRLPSAAAVSRRVQALAPRGANSSMVHVLQHKKIAGRPNQENGSMVGSFMRAPQEKPSIGSTI